MKKWRMFFKMLLICILCSAFYYQGFQHGKDVFYEKTGRQIYFHQQDIEFVKQYVLNDLENSLQASKGDSKALDDYRIQSVNPNVIFDVNGNKRICYDVVYDVKVGNDGEKLKKYPSSYWVLNGNIQDDGWILNKHDNYMIYKKDNGETILERVGEG